MPGRIPRPHPTSELLGRPLQIQQIRDGLITKRLGSNLRYFSEIDSTNTYARQRAADGADEGEIVIGETQTRGRGRLGRSWISPPFVNVYLSVILRPHLPPAHAPQLTLMAAVAVADTVDSFIQVRSTIKWPNDILVESKKLAGILTESRCDAERIEFVILGIGVNLNYPVERMPDPLRERATSIISLTETEVSREEFLRRLIHALDRCYGEIEEWGFEGLARRWEARFGLRGKKVRAQIGDQTIIGTAKGIDIDGALIVEDGRGERRRIVAGDVIPLEG
jgi:BirA family transcriptional regulator, biotin operon repressor / biotin---[acetyl-CoA-carboxylase] ligase